MEAAALLLTVALLGGLLTCGLWIGPALFVTSWILLTTFTDLPVMRILGNVVWNNANSSGLMALPLFIIMGELLGKTKVSAQLFEGLSPWVARLPGGLLHLNVLACAFFAAITGSVNATTAAVGKITIPELRSRGYDESLSIGSLTSSGTLGILIPPSVPMLIYGIAADVSIGKLFIAGLLPGLCLMILFCLYIALRSRGMQAQTPPPSSWREKMASLPKVLPVALLIALVLGSIYAGWATSTEAAAVGVLGAILLGLWTRSLTWKVLYECLVGTVRTNCMVMMILLGAAFFSVTLGFLHLPDWISSSIVGMGAGKAEAILLMTVVYLILGCLIDGYSMIVITVPMFLPLIKAFGMDPLWFGVFVIILVQAANITPPVGFNLFLMTSITKHNLGFISRSVLPFIAIMLAFTALLAVFPECALFLPNLMK